MKRLTFVTVFAVTCFMLVTGCGQSREDTATAATPSVSSSTPTTTAPGPTPSKEKAQLLSANTKKLETTLVSPDKKVHESVWVARMRGGTWKAAPSGTVIKVDPSTFQSSGVYGRVNAVVSGPIQARIILHLELTGNQWLVFAMEEVK